VNLLGPGLAPTIQDGRGVGLVAAQLAALAGKIF